MSDYRVNPYIVQSKLKAPIQWFDTMSWQLKLSFSKCGSLLLCGHASFVDACDLYAYSDPLLILDDTKDLGVVFDRYLSFSKQSDSVISKAKQRIYLIFKSFISRDIKLLIEPIFYQF